VGISEERIWVSPRVEFELVTESAGKLPAPQKRKASLEARRASEQSQRMAFLELGFISGA
jgi:hypothetical protein